jgi:hypothetical protein
VASAGADIDIDIDIDADADVYTIDHQLYVASGLAIEGSQHASVAKVKFAQLS